MLKLQRIPAKLQRELHGAFQNTRQLQMLRAAGDPIGTRIANAIETTLSEKFDAEAAEWMNKIESLRARLAADDRVISGLDFGAGSPGAGRSLQQMTEGVPWEQTVQKIARASKSRRWGMLLMEIVRQVRPRQCLELGTCVGISAAYQAAGLQRGQGGSLVTLEGAESLAELSRGHMETLGLSSVRVVVGDFARTLGGVLESMQRVDYAYIDGHHDGTATVSYFEQILPLMQDGTVMIFDDIRWSPSMHHAWNTITSHARVRLSVDLFQVGICVIGSRTTERQSFTLSID